MCPEGILPVWWDKLLEVRDAKIKHEAALHTEQQALGLMKRQLERLSEEDELAEKRIDDAVTEVNYRTNLQTAVNDCIY